MSRTRRIALPLFSSVATVLRCFATPITADQAAQATQAWIEANDTLDVPLNASVSNVVSRAVDMSGNLIHVVNLDGGGYVITSGDDQIEPVLAFSDSGEWEFSEDNPLWAILRRDASNRYETAENGRNSGQKLLSVASASPDKVKLAIARNKAKWEKLVAAKANRQAKNGIRLMASGGISSISDVRVSPLVKSKWDQSYVIKSGIFSDTKYPCYNYYTPLRGISRVGHHKHLLSASFSKEFKFGGTISVDASNLLNYRRAYHYNTESYAYREKPKYNNISFQIRYTHKFGQSRVRGAQNRSDTNYSRRFKK